MDFTDPNRRWDSLIRWTVATYWPFLDWRFAKAQVRAESGYNARAVSPAGAAGLLQLMPGTFDEIRPTKYAGCPREDPEANLVAGLVYLRTQFARFPEVVNATERLKFALASYNCGRGYVNAAIRIWRERNPGEPPSGASLLWDEVKPQLANAEVAGRRPIFQETWIYVDRVFAFFYEFASPRFAWSSSARPSSWKPTPIELPR